MYKINPIEQTRINNEKNMINNTVPSETLNILNNLNTFLKRNKLLKGYTKGTTSSMYTNYLNGLSIINPIEYDLIAERNLSPMPYWGILLNKISYQETNAFLKADKISKKTLNNNNIEITYDKRLDNIKTDKKISFNELSRLSAKTNNPHSIFLVNDFQNYIDVFALNNSLGLKDYWYQELACNSYHLLAKKYPFLQTNNTFNVILFQEEWMTILHKITGLTYFEINTLRRELKNKKQLNKIVYTLQKNLKEKFKISTNDAKQINKILCQCVYYLPCKAHIVSESYIHCSIKSKSN